MPRASVLLVCLLSTGGCASTTYAHRAGDNRIQGAFEQPFRDVSVMRENPPDVLIHAAQAPYTLPGDGGCSAILAEIAALDLVLGPDLDATDRPPPRSNTDVAALVSGAVGGIIGLPYRSIVRTLSGAERRERAVRDDIFAGMVRRAFLKGVARADNCTATSAPSSAPPDASGVSGAEPSIPQPDAAGSSEPRGNAPEPSAPPPPTTEPQVHTASALEASPSPPSQ